MRNKLVLAALLLCAAVPVGAQVSIGISSPNVRIGINLPLYPQLVRVPGYPVYYAPDLNSNYFFYDGMYWVYQDDDWYASSWYNGPWDLFEPEYVPLFVLRVPVRYYRLQPVYFRGWQADAPPHWGEHWGKQWSQRRNGWDRWDRNSMPGPAPLPVYQRQYSGDRYPRAEQQRELQSRNYRYQSREPVVRQSSQPQRTQSNPTPARPAAQRNTGQGDAQRPVSSQSPQQRQSPQQNRDATTQQQSRQPEQRTEQRQQQSKKTKQSDAERDRDKDRQKDDNRRQDRN
jgi:hypothetical protein